MSSLEKRAWAELNKLKGLSLDSNSEVKFIIDKTPFNDDGAATSNTNTFIGRILPMTSPFNQTALRVEFKLPEKYPAEPPTIRILTPIHHPNVLDDGTVCLSILRPEDSWKPSFFLSNIIEELVKLIDHPNLNEPVNDTVANEYLKNKNEYDSKALSTIRNNPVSRTA